MRWVYVMFFATERKEKWQTAGLYKACAEAKTYFIRGSIREQYGASTNYPTFGIRCFINSLHIFAPTTLSIL